MGKPTVYADFNNGDPRGRLRLSCLGTMQDLTRLGITLRDGMELTVTDYEGLEADAVAHYSADESRWVAVIDWDQVRDVEPSEPPGDVVRAVRGTA